MDIEALLAPYAALPHLECDGLTRAASHLLTKAGLPHTAWRGQVTHRPTKRSMAPHYWLDLADGRRIDFRARRWIGERADVPHGVFLPAEYPAVEYVGHIEVLEPLDEFVFRALVTPFPSVSALLLFAGPEEKKSGE